MDTSTKDWTVCQLVPGMGYVPMPYFVEAVQVDDAVHEALALLEQIKATPGAYCLGLGGRDASGRFEYPAKVWR